jgi:putative PIG3 family NAD(P)H quinone oxidoreductase
MKAIRVDESTPDRTLVWADAPDPIMGADDVLVDVHATALNRADLMQRAGNYAPPPGAPDILGLEMAGVVAAIGANVRGWRVGDRVCALLPGGGYAEQVAVPASLLMAIPAGWSMAQAAALPEAYLTAFVNIYMEGALAPGEHVLVHGGASGVGTAAIQLCHATSNPVLVTAGSEEKCDACRSLGADTAINYRTGDWANEVRQTAPEGIDVILDMVGADYLADNLGLLRLKGRLVLIATLSGSRAEIELRQVMSKRLRIIGSLLRPRTLAEKTEIKDRFLERFGSLMADGVVQPVIDGVYLITQANEAHQRMAANRNVGKIVLQVR